MTETELNDETVALLESIFKTYDTDKSGKLDWKEMQYMLETLGLSASREAILKMIREVDLDGNDEIDFGELIQIVQNNCGAAKGSNGISFAAVIERKKSGGPPMGWRTDKIGVGLEVEANTLTSKAAKGDWGVALTSFTTSNPQQAFPVSEEPQGAWLSSKEYSYATALLEIVELDEGSDAYVGIVGRNFQARKVEDGEWNIELGRLVTPGSIAPWAAVKLSTGEVFLKGKMLGGLSLGKVTQGQRIAYEIETHTQTVAITALKMVVGKDGKPTDDPPQWNEVIKIDIPNVPPEICLAVALVNGEGSSSSIRFVGSWCAKTPKATAAQADGTDSAKNVSAKTDPMTAAAQATAM